MAVDWLLSALEDDGVGGAELVVYLDGEHGNSSSALSDPFIGCVLFHLLRDWKAMMAMTTLATTPAAEWAMRLNAIQQIEARAAKTNPSFLWCPRRYMDRNMKTAAAQSSP